MNANAFAKSLFINTTGRLPGLSSRLEKIAYWTKFSRWCVEQGSSAIRSRVPRSVYFERIVAGEQLRDEAFDYLEFGVYEGASLKWWRDHALNPECQFVGFDTFMGLPQNWTESSPMGKFSTNGRIPVMDDSRFSFEVGLFQQTLPAFLSCFKRRRRLIVHMDADLYSSTLFVLTTIGHLFEARDLVLFDEFSSVTHEFRAFTDFLSIFELPYEVAFATSDFNKVCLKISNSSAQRGVEKRCA